METMTLISIDTIWIVTNDTSALTTLEGGKGAVGSKLTWSKRVQSGVPASKGVPMSVQRLEAEMTRFLEIFGRLFSRAEPQAIPHSGLPLQEIELSVEITAERDVKVGGKGATTLKFKSIGLQN